MNSLADFFEKQVTQFGSRPALVMRPRYRTMLWTYAELREKTKTLEHALAQHGVEAGDRVLLFSPNSPYWVAGFFAILCRGAIVVPLNPQSPPEQLNRIAAKVAPKLLLKSVRFPWEGELLPQLEIEIAAELAERTKEERPLSQVSISPQDLAEIVFTSGTTGDPKGVMLTHANLLSNLEALSQAIPLKPTDHFLCLLPLFHMYAQMTSLFFPMRHGAAITYLPSVSSRVIREALAVTPATFLIAVPEFLKTVMNRLEKKLEEHHLAWMLKARLLQQLPFFARRLFCGFIRRRISKTLHIIASGGAPLDPQIERKWRALGFHVLQGYGLTETSPVVSMNTYSEHRLGTVGKALPGVAVKLSSDGEIWIQGPSVTPGYYQDEAYTQSVFAGKWFKSGDGGEIDEEGFITVYGRKKYMILGPGGENVFPEDIEAELNKIAGVKDSAVVGLEVDGHTVIHAVLLCDQGEIDPILEEANRHLAGHQQIMEGSLWPQADFPRSATRKVKKEEVLRWLKSRREEKRELPLATVTPLIRLLAHVTECDPHTIHSETRIVPDLHLDSLLRVELVSRIEEEFNITLEERLITPKVTVAHLEDLIAQRKGKPAVLPKFRHAPLSFLARGLRPFLQHFFVFSWLPIFVKLRVTGQENLKALRGPVLLMPNHKCFLDSAIVLRVLPPRFRHRMAIAASTEVLYTKYRWFIPCAELIFNSYPFATESDENIKPSLDYTGHLIDRGWSVLIYPEGHMNPTNRPLLPLKGGAGVLAVEMQRPVVPIALVGTEIVLPPGKMVPRARGVVEVRIGKPIQANRNTFAPKVTAQIEEALLELLR